jgi:uncharacterized membrane protein YcaP (DUF421 family)
VFFDDWEGVWRTLVVGVCAYVALIALLRISGKRTLSQLNAFDFVVTVALGSTLATILLSADVALAEGVTALALLIALQYAVTWTSARSSRIREGVRSSPTMIAYQGELLVDALRRQRVTEHEVNQVLRQHGVASLDEVGAVVLETDGSFAVLSTAPASPGAL